MENTLLEILNKTIDFYTNKNIERNTIEAVFSHALKISRIELYTNFSRILTEDEKNEIRNNLQKLLKEEKTDSNTETLKSLLDKSISYLQKHNVDEAKLKAEIIFANTLKLERMSLFLEYKRVLTNEEKEIIRSYIKKLAIDKIPLAYLFNEKNFYGYSFYVDNSVLIPRQDTEVLVEKVLENVNKNDLILDIGCGSGAIGLTIAKERSDTKVLLTDISQKCINVTKINMQKLEISNAKAVCSDLFENIDFNKFNIIVSNPPYIDILEEVYMSEDTKEEPEIALFASEEGYYFYHEIAKEAKNYLVDNGLIFFEIGFSQRERVENILKHYGYKDILTFQDLEKRDRVVMARK